MPTVPVAGQYDEGERFGGENDVAGPELSHAGSEILSVVVTAGSRKSQQSTLG